MAAETPEWRITVANSPGAVVGDHNTVHTVNVEVRAAHEVPAPAGLHNLPPASPVFEGRDEDVFTALISNEPGGLVVGQAAVHGLGGIGKTELALQYAHRTMGRYVVTWWVTADTPESLTAGLVRLVTAVHPAATALGDTYAAQWASEWLRSHQEWLLILDNVDAFDLVQPLLHDIHGRGQVVITTRLDPGVSEWEQLGFTSLRLDVLPRQASIAVLTRITGLADDAGADRLAELLGDLPLAIRQAGSYLAQRPRMTYDGYRRLFLTEFEKIADQGAWAGPTQKTIAVTWETSLAAVRARMPEAIALLDRLAALQAGPVHERLLTDHSAGARRVSDALAVLTAYGLITRSGQTVSLHRVLHAVIRQSLPRRDRDLVVLWCATADRLADALPAAALLVADNIRGFADERLAARSLAESQVHIAVLLGEMADTAVRDAALLGSEDFRLPLFNLGARYAITLTFGSSHLEAAHQMRLMIALCQDIPPAQTPNEQRRTDLIQLQIRTILALALLRSRPMGDKDPSAHKEAGALLRQVYHEASRLFGSDSEYGLLVAMAYTRALDRKGVDRAAISSRYLVIGEVAAARLGPENPLTEDAFWHFDNIRTQSDAWAEIPHKAFLIPRSMVAWLDYTPLLVAADELSKEVRRSL